MRSSARRVESAVIQPTVRPIASSSGPIHLHRGGPGNQHRHDVHAAGQRITGGPRSPWQGFCLTGGHLDAWRKHATRRQPHIKWSQQPWSSAGVPRTRETAGYRRTPRGRRVEASAALRSFVGQIRQLRVVFRRKRVTSARERPCPSAPCRAIARIGCSAGRVGARVVLGTTTARECRPPCAVRTPTGRTL